MGCDMSLSSVGGSFIRFLQLREIDEEGYAIRPNKSAAKREMAAIRRLVEALIDCSEEEWARMGLEGKLQEGLRQARRMKASGARNRQIKFLARRLREDGLEAARAWFENRDRMQAEARRRFRSIETWRDRLVAEGDAALQAYLEIHPQTDRQQLRALIRAARRECDAGKPAGAGRRLFRFLRENSDAADFSATLEP